VRFSRRSLPNEKSQMTCTFWDFDGKTTGTPLFLSFRIPIKIRTIFHIKDNYRPSHADYEKIWNSITVVADGSMKPAELWLVLWQNKCYQK
jgi:hypothetical protein